MIFIKKFICTCNSSKLAAIRCSSKNFSLIKLTGNLYPQLSDNSAKDLIESDECWDHG